MGDLLPWVIVSTYLAIAVFVASVFVRREFAEDGDYDPTDPEDRMIMTSMGLAVGLFWPLVGIWAGLVWFLCEPAAKDKERRKQLRQDRDEWSRCAQYADSAEERETAQMIVETLDDILERGRR